MDSYYLLLYEDGLYVGLYDFVSTEVLLEMREGDILNIIGLGKILVDRVDSHGGYSWVMSSLLESYSA